MIILSVRYFSVFLNISRTRMKKLLLLIAPLAVILTVTTSCEKKGDENAIKPTYGATGNPNPNNQTVTGSTTYSNPATQNTSILVGTTGWSNLTCASTNSATLKGTTGNTEVTLNFAGAATSNTYAISTVPAAGACAMTIVNAPNQPAGLVWYGKSGSVVVSIVNNNINAVFSNVVCTQQTFNFPTVNATGTLSCN
jgi:hypothetical protein